MDFVDVNCVRINEDEIATSHNGGYSVITYLLVRLQSAHIDTVRHDDTVIAEVLAKPILNNWF